MAPWSAMIPLLLLACTPAPPAEALEPRTGETGEPPEPTEDSSPELVADTATAATGDTAPPTAPCTGVEAIFFDLGETLVTEVDEVFQPIPDAVETIEALKRAGFRVGLVTNTGLGWDEDDLRDLLPDPTLLDVFEVVLMSSQASSPPKPSAAIFLEAHALLAGGPPIEATAFVTEEIGDLADRAESPTEGARAAGMYGVLVSERPDPLADATVADLPAILGADWLCL